MPIYEYECQHCGETTSLMLHKYDTTVLPDNPCVCGKTEWKRTISAFRVKYHQESAQYGRIASDFIRANNEKARKNSKDRAPAVNIAGYHDQTTGRDISVAEAKAIDKEKRIKGI